MKMKMLRTLATGFARVLHHIMTLESRGRREDRVAAAPGALAQKICASAKTTGTGGDHTGLPCAMVYGLFPALLGEPAFATVAWQALLAQNLAPVWARQDTRVRRVMTYESATRRSFT